MSGSNLIAADTATVVAAGHNTAGIGQVWESWASRCAYAFAEAGRAMGSARIELAASSYSVHVVDGARRVGRLVESLGGDTASAGIIVDSTDAEAAGMLSRPLNGTKTIV